MGEYRAIKCFQLTKANKPSGVFSVSGTVVSEMGAGLSSGGAVPAAREDVKMMVQCKPSTTTTLSVQNVPFSIICHPGVTNCVGLTNPGWQNRFDMICHPVKNLSG